ncbi:MAG: hypothetical protein GF364_15330 [Candidatus Lokiarchaeota archaeon]|nr:hypothetical protein [Candidatus Lokiarchaeota archaeon]
MSKNEKVNKVWSVYFPYLFVTCMLVANYLSGVKLVQLGIPHLGGVVCSVPEAKLNLLMALMAVNACVVGIISGFLLNKVSLQIKSRLFILLGSFGIQGAITFFANFLSEPFHFTIWIIVFSLVLGFLLCQPFVFVFLLIPSKNRGILAGLITGLAYLVGNMSMVEWTFKGLSLETIIVTIPLGILILIALFNLDKLKLLDFNEEKEKTHYSDKRNIYSFGIIVVLMFGVYFVDSFGFLRLKGEPFFLLMWGGKFGVKIWLGIVHLISALIMGWIYQKRGKYGPMIVFISAFIGFIVGDLLFASYPSGSLLLVSSYIYCSAVSFYTINGFILWADLSDKTNISGRAGIGIGIGGWLSSFLSTALTEEIMNIIEFKYHLIITALLAGFFLVISLFYYKKLRIS